MLRMLNQTQTEIYHIFWTIDCIVQTKHETKLFILKSLP